MSDQRGQVTVLILGMAMVVFSVVGLAADGTRAFLYRRSLQSAADAAAMAGAGELDRATYYASRGRRVELDEGAARRVTARWLGLRSVGADPSILVAEDRVRVVLRGTVPTLFLRLIGLEEVRVAVEAVAAPAIGP